MKNRQKGGKSMNDLRFSICEQTFMAFRKVVHSRKAESSRGYGSHDFTSSFALDFHSQEPL